MIMAFSINKVKALVIIRNVLLKILIFRERGREEEGEKLGCKKDQSVASWYAPQMGTEPAI